ncbi:MAG: carboxylating nicotinate-nucleotide diphosphorylase [Verrucomicrobiae bacterium]|nr:carboxylating nicotinate-nucleotide diphosphorylase [Verrucomicrobiae bacterium]
MDRSLLDSALAEDIGSGDITSRYFIPPGQRGRARIVARQRMVVSGLGPAREVFSAIDAGVGVSVAVADGDALESGGVILEAEGLVRSLLTAERIALNFLQHLGGVATLTRRFVEAVAGTRAAILDTRKTLPGWRALEKAAVRHGGGLNHRMGLHDAVLVKDNHIAAARAAGLDLGAIVGRVRAENPGILVQFEADTLEQVQEFVGLGADAILLDNMSLDELRRAVALVGGRCRTEASGGVTLETVRSIAETGVDLISIGALTHSAPAADISMELRGLPDEVRQTPCGPPD